MRPPLHPLFLGVIAAAIAAALIGCAEGERPAPEPASAAAHAALTAGDVHQPADVAPADDAVTADAEATEPAKAPVRIDVTMDYWPFAIEGDALRSAAVAGDGLFVASQTTPERPRVDPGLIRIQRHRAADGTVTGQYAAEVLDPGPVALAASGNRVLAVWSQEIDGRRAFALHRMAADGDPASGTTRPLGLDTGRRAKPPVGAPLLAAADDGWLLCTDVDRGAPQCGALDRRARGALTPLRDLRSYGLWRLLEAPAGGFYLLASSCDPARCRQPRIMLQRLRPDGSPGGRVRVMTRLQARRGMGAFTVADGALLFGKRIGAKHGTAFLIDDDGVRELDGRWTRTVGGVALGEGALLLDVATLRMVGDRPSTGFRPRLWDPETGRAEKSPAWPADVEPLLPVGMDQALAVHDRFFIISRHDRGVTRGVALRPGRRIAPKVEPDPSTDTPAP